MPRFTGDAHASQILGLGLANGFPVDGAREFDPNNKDRWTWYEEFDCIAGVSLATAQASRARLVQRDVSAAGTPTTAFVDSEPLGIYRNTMSNTSEATELGIDSNDKVFIDPTKRPLIEMRFGINTDGADLTGGIFVAGVCDAYNATKDTIARSVWMRAEGANLNILIEADDGTATTFDDADTGLDYADGDRMVLRIDMYDLSDVKMYIKRPGDTCFQPLLRPIANGVRPAIDVNDLLTTHLLQPIIQIQKASGTSVHGFDIDYIRIEQDR